MELITPLLDTTTYYNIRTKKLEENPETPCVIPRFNLCTDGDLKDLQTFFSSLDLDELERRRDKKRALIILGYEEKPLNPTKELEEALEKPLENSMEIYSYMEMEFHEKFFQCLNRDVYYDVSTRSFTEKEGLESRRCLTYTNPRDALLYKLCKGYLEEVEDWLDAAELDERKRIYRHSVRAKGCLVIEEKDENYPRPRGVRILSTRPNWLLRDDVERKSEYKLDFAGLSKDFVEWFKKQ